MDPQNSESRMELPPPVENLPSPDMPRETLPDQAEQGGRPAAQERAPAGQAPGAAMPASIPLPTPPVMAQQKGGGPSSVSPTANLRASDDSDLIEKEWVNKAKQIVERTRDDPYKQSEELTVVKADYLKKRYNKTIKIK
jgi:hypothetical protein